MAESEPGASSRNQTSVQDTLISSLAGLNVSEEPAASQPPRQDVDIEDAPGDELSPNTQDKKKKKKKKKSVTAAKLGGVTELAFDSASNVYNHAQDKNMDFLFANLALDRVVEGLTPRDKHMPGQVSQDVTTEIIQQRRGIAGQPSVDEAIELFRDKPTAESFIRGLTIAHSHTLDVPANVTAIGFGGNQESNDTWCAVLCTMLQRNFLRAHPLFTATLVIEPHVTKIPVRVVDFPGRGKGLVATRPIAKGTVFIREPPLLVAFGAYNPSVMIGFNDIIVKTMHPRAMTAYDALHSCRPKSDSRRLDILRTNGWYVELYPPLNQAGSGFPDDKHTAVFQTLSRVNHSCVPNSAFDWSYVHFQGMFRALQDIAVGDEITASYLGKNNLSSTALRRKALKTKYEFECTCKRCGNTEEQSSETLGNGHDLIFETVAKAHDHSIDVDLKRFMRRFNYTRFNDASSPTLLPNVSFTLAEYKAFAVKHDLQADLKAIDAAPGLHGDQTKIIYNTIQDDATYSTDDRLALRYPTTHLRAHPLFDKQLFIEPLVADVPFRIDEIHGRGMGLVATRRIAAGSVLYREPPLALMAAKRTFPLTMRMEAALRAVMHPRALAAYEALHACRAPQDNRLLDIWRTNAHSATIGMWVSSAVFQVLSRANHNCKPNSAFEWAYDVFQGRLIALKDIAPGEEITISYVGNTDNKPTSTAQRRNELKEKYKFDCICEACGPL
ncbi:hypothetical protein BKA62DRAFT_770332 [Auriculariales sp. MPI-PUGE-AT-0066]|nr:hypothetical protein BKA62DRAFT_770332 [Auriculariales sp. MPI-PUGE-AT-0066]